MFNKPRTLSAFAIRLLYSVISLITFSGKLNGGKTANESPE